MVVVLVFVFGGVDVQQVDVWVVFVFGELGVQFWVLQVVDGGFVGYLGGCVVKFEVVVVVVLFEEQGDVWVMVEFDVFEVVGFGEELQYVICFYFGDGYWLCMQL